MILAVGRVWIKGNAVAARLDTVARFICKRSGWKLSNLSLQKILYMAQLYYMGKNNGARLVDTHFEAWDYGPVSPELYHKAKVFGAGPVEDVFYSARVFGKDDPRRALLIEVADDLLDISPGELVNITHWQHGAWAKHYVPKARGIRIPDEDILKEYRDRLA